jgi:hypothetical protein
VRKWLPAILIGFSLSQVNIGGKTELTGPEGVIYAWNSYQLSFVAETAATFHDALVHLTFCID